MMRLPLPIVLAALVVVAAGSVLVNMYFKSDGAYVLDVSDLQLNQTKVVELDYIPHKIMLKSNKSNAVYEIFIYIDGTFIVPFQEAPHYYDICHNVYYTVTSNGTVLLIKPIDVKSTHVKIVATYVYNWPA